MSASQHVPIDLPVIDLDLFLQRPRDSEAVQVECLEAATALIKYGALVLHDSRASEDDNSTFLDLLEDYFAQPEEVLKKDERPELSYQIGVTLENTERPKCAVDEACLKVIERLDPAERPLDITAHAPDPKCRFFWRMFETPPYETQFPGLNADNVTPEAAGIKERWPGVMDQWGKTMKNAAEGLAQMAAVGMGLPATTFTDAGKYGPHLLAPTASDLQRHGKKGTILAGFHTDLNFLTIHGRSRYPGLHIWARNTGKRISVKMPPTGNYLLVQAGKQLEHLTGGLVKAGFHEVVVNDATLATIQRRKQIFSQSSLVRISSTFFWHLSSDYELVPIPALAEQAKRVRAEQFNMGKDEGGEVEYATIKVGEQVQSELKHIALMA